METRSNHVWVGAVTLALLALLAVFIVWVARLNQGSLDEYDIFFKQSVDGLSNGSTITYAGVPAGQVSAIELWDEDPSFVRVRIQVEEKIPILQGTTATITSGFTGVAAIQLNGGTRGAPEIVEPGPEGVPVIPTKRGGLGELLTNAPLLMDRLATLAENLNNIMSEDNQKTLRSILVNTDQLTGNLAEASPQVKPALAELQTAIKQATATLAKIEIVAGSADRLINEDGQPLMRQLRATLASAQSAVEQLEDTLKDTRPAARHLADTTLPAADAAIRDLQAASRALRDVMEKVDNQGAGALIGGSKLPDYKP